MLAPITVLGVGRRLGLWVQGCRLRCPGCASSDTWVEGEGRMVDATELADTIVAEIQARRLDGLTLTGGEPLDQAEALAVVVERVRQSLAGREDRFDVLVFTGYAARAAPRQAGRLWSMIDVAVCGPYRHDLPSELALVASANQKMVILSQLGRSLYLLPADGPRMQVVSDGTELMMVGLPKPGDLDVLRQRMADKGVMIEGVTWRS